MCCAGLFDAHSALLGVRRGGAWNAGDVEIPPGMAEQVQKDAAQRADVRAAEEAAERAKQSAKSSAFMLAVVVGVVLLIGTGAIRGDGP